MFLLHAPCPAIAPTPPPAPVVVFAPPTTRMSGHTRLLLLAVMCAQCVHCFASCRFSLVSPPPPPHDRPAACLPAFDRGWAHARRQTPNPPPLRVRACLRARRLRTAGIERFYGGGARGRALVQLKTSTQARASKPSAALRALLFLQRRIFKHERPVGHPNQIGAPGVHNAHAATRPPCFAADAPSHSRHSRTPCTRARISARGAGSGPQCTCAC